MSRTSILEGDPPIKSARGPRAEPQTAVVSDGGIVSRVVDPVLIYIRVSTP
jgi:hypothetical protein